MPYSPPKYSTYTFTLHIEGPENHRVITEKKLGKELIRIFSKPLTTGKLPKLYLILSKGVVHYIGYSHQSISSRLGYGFRADGSKGYHGYKWVNEEEATLLVWCFGDAIADKEELKAAKKFFEGVEAELAFRVREKTGRWPESQNEIHFNNEDREEVLKLARNIYDSIQDQESNSRKK